MSTKYPQGVITATPPFQSTTAQSFSGVWTLEQLGKNYFYYQQPVAKSLRFRSSASAYLNRTPSTGGNRTTWTWSGWVKRGALGATQVLFGAASSPNGSYFRFESSDALRFYDYNGVTFSPDLITTQVFRDPSAWYHVVLVSDTTNATAADRVRLYVNGTQVTAFSTATYPAQNANNTSINNTYPTTIGAASATIDGYLAEINFIDGQALDPSYFGQLSTITGVWAPKKYVGSYGGNGFYLPFTDATSTTTLGYDSSGNGNNWTTNNISLTSGVTYDSMWDSPTSYDNGVNGVGNYAVLNPLAKTSLSNVDTVNMRVYWTNNASAVMGAQTATIQIPSSGKYYFEGDITYDGNNGFNIGVCGIQDIAYGNNVAPSKARYYRSSANNGAYGYWSESYFTNNNSNAASGSMFSVAIDMDSGKFWVAINGSWQGGGNPATGTSPGWSDLITAGVTWIPYFGGYNWTGTQTISNVNFGQRPFAYTPPTGFKALNTQNLPAVSIANGANHMAATLYTGNGGTQSIVNAYNSVSFQPDFVWVKDRTTAYGHILWDSVRGISNYLSSSSTAAEGSAPTALTSLNANGFTLGNVTSVNANGDSFIGWQWKAGGTAVTNTAGSITSSVSANTTSGFSVVTYTMNGSASATIGHGLGVTPSMIIFKDRSSTQEWGVYHVSLGATAALSLNTTGAANTWIGWFNNTAPTSTVMTLSRNNNTVGDLAVAYCFAAIPGYSAFGSYTGNGSTNGPFVYCGFRPRFVLTKRTAAAGNWQISDTSRTPSNVVGQFLQANLSNAEATATEYDILSNGFKLRSTDGDFNTSGEIFIYAAFAENPFKYSLAR